MVQNAEPLLMLFYSNFNQVSLTTRSMLAELLCHHALWQRINFTEVDCDREVHLKMKYHVCGVPTLLTFAGSEMTGRYLGEITKSDMLAIMQSMLDN